MTILSWFRGGCAWLLVILLSVVLINDAIPQEYDRALITHSSESLSLTPLLYGIERGFYRREGIDLQFRLLRSELAVAAMIGRKEVDYIVGAGGAFTAAVRGVPIVILAHDLKSVLFYLMGQPNVNSGKDLRGGKVAVVSLAGAGAAAARATLRALGLDPDSDVTMIVIGSASVRLAAMEVGSVHAAIMPVPWNITMKKKGFTELLYAGKVMSLPLTGIVATKEKIDTNPGQVRRVLRGFIASLDAVKRERKEVIGFISRKFKIDAEVAEEVYGTLLDTLTEDGTVPTTVLAELLATTKAQVGVKKDIPLTSIVDYRLLREISKGVR